MEPPVRPPRLRCGLFPSIYLPHLLVLPATFGLQRLLPPYPYFPALYVVPVRQARGLPSASSRFHLTMDTLAVQLCASSLPTRTRDFHPLESAHVGRTKRVHGKILHVLMVVNFFNNYTLSAVDAFKISGEVSADACGNDSTALNWSQSILISNAPPRALA